MQKKIKVKPAIFKFPKAATGIQGFDEITTGGLPKNRPALLAGNAGSGKTLMGMQFLVNGAMMYDETGVFMTFEERKEDLILNVGSLGYDLNDLIIKKKLYVEQVRINRDQVLKTGDYSIEGLFVRLEAAINAVKAKRVVLDSLDTLFSRLDISIIRAEFQRLFGWLKDKKVTAIITAEVGEDFITHLGLEEYIADCVILLDNRVKDQITTRRLRIVKYRGSYHGNNEYPFVIDENGITVFPMGGEGVQQKTSLKRISSGIATLDEMLGKKGFYVGSSVLVSGTAGTGKTSVSASFANSVCKNNHRCLFCAFEEAPNQIIRNMKSIGIDLKPFVQSNRLRFYYARPTLQNLELHFIAIKKIINEIKPTVIILDPITNLMTEGPNSDVRSMLTRFVDYIKVEQITVMFTAAITVGSIARNPSDEGISSMVDTWMMVQDIEVNNERTRSLCIMKSRGMLHSNQVKKFTISNKGVVLSKLDVDIEAEKSINKRKAKEHENLATS